MPKKKSDDEQIFIIKPEGTNIVQIHVTGDMMPNSVFLKILEYMKIYQGRTVIFVVYDVKMLLLIRKSPRLREPSTWQTRVTSHLT